MHGQNMDVEHLNLLGTGIRCNNVNLWNNNYLEL